jgi:hypothetical protein
MSHSPLLNHPRHHTQRSQHLVFERPSPPARGRKALYCKHGTRCPNAKRPWLCDGFHAGDERRGWRRPDLADAAVRQQLLDEEPFYKTSACPRGDACDWVRKSAPSRCPGVHPCEGLSAPPPAAPSAQETPAPPPAPGDFPPLPRRSEDRAEPDWVERLCSSDGEEEDTATTEASSEDDDGDKTSSASSSPPASPTPAPSAQWCVDTLRWLDAEIKRQLDRAEALQREYARTIGEVAAATALRDQIDAALRAQPPS